MQKTFSIEAEQAALGSVMIDGSMYSKCNLAAEDFYRPVHQQIWRSLTRLNVSRETIDPVSVAEQLERDDCMAPKGGWLEYLVKLVNQTPSAANAESYANMVRGYSIHRRAIAVGKRLTSLEDVDDVESCIRDLINITATRQSYHCTLAEAMSSVIDMLDKSSSNRMHTGFADVDRMLGGFFDDDLVVCGARPAMGKTAWMLNLALSCPKPVGVISGEQGRDQLGMRCIAIDKEVSLHHMRTGDLGDDEWIRINDAIKAAKDKRIYVYDKPAPTIDEICQRARQWKYENNIGMLTVDYLQKIAGGEGKDFRLQVGNIASRLKNLARELKIPVIVLAQVSREVEKRPLGNDYMGRMPYAADLAESAIIENEADIIMTLYRPEVYTNLPMHSGVAFVNICKNRHGPIGFDAVSWRGEYLKFGDLEKVQTEWKDGEDKDKWAYKPQQQSLA